MKRYVKCPDWALKIVSGLCFSQVKEQLPDNLRYYPLNPQAFICNGQLFAYVQNQMLIEEVNSKGPENLVSDHAEDN